MAATRGMGGYLRHDGRCHTGDMTYDGGDAWDGGCLRHDGRCHTGDVAYDGGDAWDGGCLWKTGVVTPEI